jgi:glycosyltransferase involved in cell wall biosynthesis
VSVEAAKWAWALGELGFEVHLVDGPGLATDAGAALDGADVVVADNVLSLPMDPAVTAGVARALRGRPAIVRHHDLPWQRPQWRDRRVDDDRAWAHVVINSRSATELRDRQGIDAAVLPNRFPLDGWLPPRPHEGRVVLHPVRAIPRKDVPAAVALAERLGATYWLTGPAEDGYADELAEVLAGASCPVRHEPAPSMAAAYAVADVVAFPSTVEGFGNPVIESALARRPLAVRRYPVLVDDLEPFGFRWFAPDDADGRLARFLDEPDDGLLDHNEALAREHFGLDRLPAELAAVLERVL